jgi:hypothetical protein
LPGWLPACLARSKNKQVASPGRSEEEAISLAVAGRYPETFKLDSEDEIFDED